MMAIFLASIHSSCKTQKSFPDNSLMLEQIIQTDKDFSSFSLKHGLVEAFIQFADVDAVYLRDNSMPLEGKSNIASYFRQFEGVDMQLSWEPTYGDVAASGDLGYTYGIYTYVMGSSTQRGTYVSIWKKQVDGNWKWVLDSGNDGLE